MVVVVVVVIVIVVVLVVVEVFVAVVIFGFFDPKKGDSWMNGRTRPLLELPT